MNPLHLLQGMIMAALPVAVFILIIFLLATLT